MHPHLHYLTTPLFSLLAPVLIGIHHPTPRPFDAHNWEIVEIFSTADGQVQFIEWLNPDPDEQLMAAESVSSNTQTFNFPTNLPSSQTANRRFLMATAAFAALPGAPTPDYIIPANFFNRSGDTLDYSGGDAVTFGALPTNSVSSITRTGVVQANSPTNFAGTVGSINAALATFTPFGVGCAHAPGQTMSVSANRPVLGQNWVITWNQRPSPEVIAILGTSNQVGLGLAGTPVLPFELSGFGMPGCHLRASADVFSLLVPTGVWTLGVPNQAALIGIAVHVQGFAQAPGVNALGVVASNAGTGVVGAR